MKDDKIINLAQAVNMLNDIKANLAAAQTEAETAKKELLNNSDYKAKTKKVSVIKANLKKMRAFITDNMSDLLANQKASQDNFGWDYKNKDEMTSAPVIVQYTKEDYR